MPSISTSTPTIAQLRAFLAVAAHLHFREAANSLRMSQSALSSAVSSLEETLGTQLLERTTRKVLLTPAGGRVAMHATRVLRAMDDLMYGAARSREPFTGEVRLGVIPTVAPYLLPALLPMFAARFPKLTLTVQEAQTEDVLERLREGDLDVVLLALPTAASGVVEVPLYDEEFLLAVPEDHPLAIGTEPLPRETLKELDIVLLNRGHCLREQALDVCREVGARATMATYATSLPTLVQLVAHGLGVTLIPETAVPVETGRGVPVALRRFGDPAPGRRIGLAYRASSARGGEFRELAEAIREVLYERELPVRMIPGEWEAAFLDQAAADGAVTLEPPLPAGGGRDGER